MELIKQKQVEGLVDKLAAKADLGLDGKVLLDQLPELPASYSDEQAVAAVQPLLGYQDGGVFTPDTNQSIKANRVYTFGLQRWRSKRDMVANAVPVAGANWELVFDATPPAPLRSPADELSQSEIDYLWSGVSTAYTAMEFARAAMQYLGATGEVESYTQFNDLVNQYHQFQNGNLFIRQSEVLCNGPLTGTRWRSMYGANALVQLNGWDFQLALSTQGVNFNGRRYRGVAPAFFASISAGAYGSNPSYLIGAFLEELILAPGAGKILVLENCHGLTQGNVQTKGPGTIWLTGATDVPLIPLDSETVIVDKRVGSGGGGNGTPPPGSVTEAMLATALAKKVNAFTTDTFLYNDVSPAKKQAVYLSFTNNNTGRPFVLDGTAAVTGDALASADYVGRNFVDIRAGSGSTIYRYYCEQAINDASQNVIIWLRHQMS